MCNNYYHESFLVSVTIDFSVRLTAHIADAIVMTALTETGMQSNVHTMPKNFAFPFCSFHRKVRLWLSTSHWTSTRCNFYETQNRFNFLLLRCRRTGDLHALHVPIVDCRR